MALARSEGQAQPRPGPNPKAGARVGGRVGPALSCREGGAPGSGRGRGGAGLVSGSLKQASPAPLELAPGAVGFAEGGGDASAAPGMVMGACLQNVHIRYSGVLIEKLITVAPFRVG